MDGPAAMHDPVQGRGGAGATDTAMPRHELLLANSFPTPLRVVLGTIAAICAGLLVTELWPGIWPPTMLTPFFGLIVLGGLSVCGTMVVGCVFGSTMQVRLQDDGAHIVHVSPLGVRRERLNRGSLAGTSVERSARDDGPDVFRVVLVLGNGRTIRLPEMPSREAADEAAGRFMTVLGPGNGTERASRTDRRG